MRAKIAAIISAAAGAYGEVVPADKSAHGHYSTNIALRLAQAEGRNSLEYAQDLAERINNCAPANFFEKVEAVPPGFINFWLTSDAIQREFGEILQRGGVPAFHPALAGKKIVVEYTDPNPFKQIHVGHLMTNVIGETIARLHEAVGAEVIRVTWQGDVGMHIAMAVWAWQNGLVGEAPGEGTSLAAKMEFLGRSYAAGVKSYRAGDERIKKAVETVNKSIYERTNSEINRLYDLGRQWSLDYFETFYARMGSKFTRYFFESEEGPAGLALVKAHPEIFIESNGAVIFKGEDYGLHTRVFVNAQGLPTYEAKELGLNQRKFELYQPDLSLIVTGNEINEYFRVLKKVMELVLPEVGAKTVHIGHGMLRLPSGKMSSRTGEVVAAEALLEEIKRAVAEEIRDRAGLTAEEKEKIKEDVAVGAIRYSILKQNIGKDIIFEMKKAVSFQGDSGAYLQYAHARLRSIIRKSQISNLQTQNLKLSQLQEEAELELIRKIVDLPFVVQIAVQNLAPNLLANFLHELANQVNTYYETTPVLQAEPAARDVRLLLVETVARVLKNGLAILGIPAPEKI